MSRKKSECIELLVPKNINSEQRPSAPSLDCTLSRNYSNENYRNLVSNGIIYTSVWPEKIPLLTQKEQDELKDVSWFQAGLPREISLEILLQQIPGSFLVRQSESNKKYFALSMRITPLEPPKLSHYLIERTQKGFRFKRQSKEFSSLQSLVIHHSVLKEHLPITLMLPRSNDVLIHKLFYADNSKSNESWKDSLTTLCFGKKSK